MVFTYYLGTYPENHSNGVIGSKFNITFLDMVNDYLEHSATESCTMHQPYIIVLHLADIHKTHS